MTSWALKLSLNPQTHVQGEDEVDMDDIMDRVAEEQAKAAKTVPRGALRLLRARRGGQAVGEGVEDASAGGGDVPQAAVNRDQVAKRGKGMLRR